EDLTSNFVTRNKVAYEYIVTGNDARGKEFIELTKESQEIEKELLENYSNEEVEEVIALAGEWSEDVKKSVINQMAQGNDLIASSSLNNLNPIANEILSFYENSLDILDSEVVKVGKEVDQSQNYVLITTLSIGVIAIIASIAIAWVTSKSITDAIREMKDRLEAFSKEDFSAEPLVVKTRDEIGDLAASLNMTQENLVVLMMSVQETVEQLLSTSKETMSSGHEVQTGSGQIAATMQELASGAESQANSASALAVDMDTFSTVTKDTLTHGEEIYRSSEAIAQKANQGNELMALSTDQ